MLLLSLCLVLFVVILALPAIPSMLEVARPKDDGRLDIPQAYVRDPRWFGTSFRRKLEPFVAAARERGPSRSELHMRTDEDVQWAPDLNIPGEERLRGIGIGLRVNVGRGAGIRDAYALESLTVEPDVVARTLTSNATMSLGASVRILRWIDSDGPIDVGTGTDLGLSASGGERVTLADGVHFERVWGAPVATSTKATAPLVQGDPAATVVDAKMVIGDKSVIVYGPARVAAGTRIPLHLKVNGPVELESGAHVEGNVIARGDVTVATNVTVRGHIFSEGTIRLGPGTRVAHAGIAKTVYAAGEVILANDVEVFGWVVAENGGRTL
jgi:hypothetical protein